MVPTSSVIAFTTTIAGRETTTSITESNTNSQVPITTTTVITMVFTGTPTTTPTSHMVIASSDSEMCTFVKGGSIETQCLSGFCSYLRYGATY